VYKKKTESTICPDGKNATHGLHLPLTLDEYCTPSLSDATLLDRNKDQVVIRVATRHKQERERKDKKPAQSPPIAKARKEMDPTTRLLMVHQLWVYRFDNTHIISFPEVLLRQPGIMKILKSHFPLSRSFDDALILSTLDIMSMTSIALWLSGFIYLLETPIGLEKPVLDIFEESTSVISNDVDEYFNKKTPKEQEKAADGEKDFFHNIADIRGELSMLRAVVTQQEQVWTTFKARLLLLLDHLDTELGFAHINAQTVASSALHVPDKVAMSPSPTAQSQGSTPRNADSQAPGKVDPSSTLQGLDTSATTSSSSSKSQVQGKAEAEAVDVPRALQLYLEDRATAIGIVSETSSLLQRLKDRIDKIDQDAERVQNLVPQYLELKRSYATIKEANYTALLGAAVFGLSLVTIVFAPLSFAVALLALPKDGLYITLDDNRSLVAKYTGEIGHSLRMALS
jgi:hypothetical protein